MTFPTSPLITSPLPVYTPLYLGTSGGFFGAVRRKVNSILDLAVIFGDRIFPGVAPPATSLPYLVLSHVSCLLDDYLGVSEGSLSLPLDTWKETVQVSVYADNYEAARQLGRAIHTRVSRHTLVIDCYPAFIYPYTRMLLRDPEKSERGGDMWHSDYRYYYWISEWVFTDSYQPSALSAWFGQDPWPTQPGKDLPPVG